MIKIYSIYEHTFLSIPKISSLFMHVLDTQYTASSVRDLLDANLSELYRRLLILHFETLAKIQIPCSILYGVAR